MGGLTLSQQPLTSLHGSCVQHYKSMQSRVLGYPRLTLSQQLLTSLNGSCTQHCKLHQLQTNYCQGVIFTFFHKERNALHTLSTTLIQVKACHVLAVRTAHEHQPSHLCSQHNSNSNISCCEDRCNVLRKC